MARTTVTNSKAIWGMLFACYETGSHNVSVAGLELGVDLKLKKVRLLGLKAMLTTPGLFDTPFVIFT